MLTTAIRYYAGFSQGIFLIVFFVLIGTYLAWRLAAFAAIGRAQPFARAVGVLLVVGAAVTALIASSVVLVTYNASSRADIPAINQALMETDRLVFGTYPPFWFQAGDNPLKPFFDALAPLLISVYNNLPIVLGLSLTALFFINGICWARMLLAFVLSLILSAPIWFLAPALSPLDAYRYPLITAEPTAEITAAITAYQPNERLQRFQEAIQSLRRPEATTFYPITTIPSMHVAWATILVYFLARAWRPSLIFGLPYAALNLLATLYTLQHYAVDLPAGLAASLVAILLANSVDPQRAASVRLIIAQAQSDARRATQPLRVGAAYLRQLWQATPAEAAGKENQLRVGGEGFEPPTLAM